MQVRQCASVGRYQLCAWIRFQLIYDFLGNSMRLSRIRTFRKSDTDLVGEYFRAGNAKSDAIPIEGTYIAKLSSFDNPNAHPPSLPDPLPTFATGGFAVSEPRE